MPLVVVVVVVVGQTKGVMQASQIGIHDEYLFTLAGTMICWWRDIIGRNPHTLSKLSVSHPSRTLLRQLRAARGHQNFLGHCLALCHREGNIKEGAGGHLGC